MLSIKEKLNIALISTLIALSLSFIVYMIVLHSFGLSLTPEAYAQIISALATTLVVVLTLGLRLIDDAFDRYEKFAKPRIVSLQSMLGTAGTKGELRSCHPTNLPARSRDLTRTSSDLTKYGRFFLTKLYPQVTLNKIAGITSDLDRFLALTRDIESYRGNADSDDFFEFVVRNNQGLMLSFRKEAKEALIKLNREKPRLITQTRKLREGILLDIDKVIDELDSLLEAN